MLYDDLIQSEGSYLSHHGVKGQKWGVRRERKKYTPVKVPRFSKDPIGYGVAKAKNFAFKDVKDATKGEKALAVGLGLGVGAIAAGNIYVASRMAVTMSSINAARDQIRAGRAAAQSHYDTVLNRWIPNTYDSAGNLVGESTAVPNRSFIRGSSHYNTSLNRWVPNVYDSAGNLIN